MIALLELEASKGGHTLAEVHELLSVYDLQGEVATDQYAKWGFKDDAPRGQALYDHLLAHEPIEWNRIGHFQDVTMRLIAVRLLPEIAGCANKVIVDNELATSTLKPLSPPKDGHVYHVFCSEHNPGADALLREMAKERGIKFELSGRGNLTRASTRQRLDSIKMARSLGSRELAKVMTKYSNTLHATQNADYLEQCGHMLVYLNSQTWTRSDGGSNALHEHVTKAMDLGVHVLLAHEMNGVGQAKRFPCEFGSFFSCPDGATPGDLLKRGIYAEVAVALKGNEWRKASMRLLSMALGMSKEETEATLEKGGLLSIPKENMRRLVRGSSHPFAFLNRTSKALSPTGPTWSSTELAHSSSSANDEELAPQVPADSAADGEDEDLRLEI